MLYNKKGGDKDEKTNIWDLAMCHTSLVEPQSTGFI